MAKESVEKPKKRGFFRTLSSTFFDLPRWININQYKQVNKTLYRDVKNVLRTPQAGREETFEAAVARQQLTEQDLQNLMKTNSRGLTMMLVLIILLCLYGIYLMFQGAIAATCLILAVITISAVRAFRFSFWNFQIKSRRLGCTFKDWLKRK